MNATSISNNGVHHATKKNFYKRCKWKTLSISACDTPIRFAWLPNAHPCKITNRLRPLCSAFDSYSKWLLLLFVFIFLFVLFLCSSNIDDVVNDRVFVVPKWTVLRFLEWPFLVAVLNIVRQGKKRDIEWKMHTSRMALHAIRTHRLELFFCARWDGRFAICFFFCGSKQFCPFQKWLLCSLKLFLPFNGSF